MRDPVAVHALTAEPVLDPDLVPVPGPVAASEGFRLPSLSTVMEVASVFLGGGAAEPFEHVVQESDARARLLHSQADLVQLEVTKRLQALEKPEVRQLGEVIDARFDIIAMGPRRSGKTRAAAKIADMARAAHVPVMSTVKRWPDWDLVRDCLLVVDEAGTMLEGGGMRDGVAQAPAELLEGLAIARARNVSTVLIAQHAYQVPPGITRHGLYLLVTKAPWAWRSETREHLRDRLDEAQAVFELHRGEPGVLVLVNPDGWAIPVRIPVLGGSDERRDDAGDDGE